MSDDARVTTDEALAHELHQLGEAVAALREEVRRSAGAMLPQDEGAGWDEDTPVSAHSWVSALAAPQAAHLRAEPGHRRQQRGGRHLPHVHVRDVDVRDVVLHHDVVPHDQQQASRWRDEER